MDNCFNTIYAAGKFAPITPISANVFESLGLGWWEILFHTVNLLILIVALRFLLYKPIKNIIANHKKKLDDVFEENKKLEKEAAEAKEKYDSMIEQAKTEMAEASKEAAENARKQSEETIAEAKKQAANIIESAARETEAEKERMKNDYRETVGRLAVDIAGKVLEREISQKDNEKIIDECLEQWEDQ